MGNRMQGGKRNDLNEGNVGPRNAIQAYSYEGCLPMVVFLHAVIVVNLKSVKDFRGISSLRCGIPRFLDR